MATLTPRAGLQARAQKVNRSQVRRGEEPEANDRHSRGRPITSTTEITLAGGERYRVHGEAKEVERLILDAARGSIMELAWLTDDETGESVGVNPEYVVMLRGLSG